MSAVLDYKRKIYAIRDLPTLPVIAQKVLSLADDDETGPEKLSSIISSDQSLSVRILSLANSAYYGHRAQIGTIRQAVALIGLNMLKQLSLSALVFGTVGRGGKDREEFWTHSFATAMASSILARRAGMSGTEVCYMGGLLHDVGKVIIDSYFPGERDLDHTEIGAWMAERWQLPRELVDAIAHHHSRDINELANRITACVHAGNMCAKAAFETDSEPVSFRGHPLRLPETAFLEIVEELRIRRSEIENLYK